MDRIPRANPHTDRHGTRDKQPMWVAASSHLVLYASIAAVAALLLVYAVRGSEPAAAVRTFARQRLAVFVVSLAVAFVFWVITSGTALPALWLLAVLVNTRYEYRAFKRQWVAELVPAKRNDGDPARPAPTAAELLAANPGVMRQRAV